MALKRFLCWFGRYRWSRTLTKSCLTYTWNKQIRKDQNTVANEDSVEEVPHLFHTVNIDHKGPLNPREGGKGHFLLIMDAFLRFSQAYLVKSTVAIHIIEAMTTLIASFGIYPKLFLMEELLS